MVRMTTPKRGRPEIITPTQLAVIEKVRLKARSKRRKFIENFLYIRDQNTRQLRKFQFNASQEVLWKYIEEELDSENAARLCILKGRQIGATTLAAALVFTEIYANDNMDALMMTHLKDRTIKSFQMHQIMLKNLPTELQLPLTQASRLGMQYVTGSGLQLATAGTTSFGRGGTVPIVHLSEAAYYPSLYEVLGALEPSIPDSPSTLVIVESTANGVGTEFHDFWNRAVEGDNDFRAIFIPWAVDPKHQRKFRDLQTRNIWKEAHLDTDNDLQARVQHYGLTMEQAYWYWWYRKNKLHGDDLLMMQEFPCDPHECFVSSGTPVFNPRLTAEYRKGILRGKRYDATKIWSTLSDLTAQEDRVEPYKSAYIEIWNTPSTGRSYVISADTAEGIEGGDYSCAYIFDVQTSKPVAVFHGRVDPHDFAKVLARLGFAYNRATIAPETHGVGIATVSKLNDIYPNVYRWKGSYDRIGGMQDTDRLGWETNILSRKIMITQAKYAWNNSSGIEHFIPDEFLLNEIGTFVYTGMDMKAQAGSGFHDDRVITWMIGQIVCAQEAQYLDTPGGIIKPQQFGGILGGEPSIEDMIRNRKNTNFITGEDLRDGYDIDDFEFDTNDGDMEDW